MRTKFQIWEIIRKEFEQDLLNDDYRHYICDVINTSEELSDEEMDSAIDEMIEYAEENQLQYAKPFWKNEDIESRREFINRKIKKYES